MSGNSGHHPGQQEGQQAAGREGEQPRAADLSGDAGTWVRDIVRNDSDYVASVTVGGIKMRGNDLRTALSLRSPSFTVEYKDNAFTFHVTGYGHGVGMSQYGANVMAAGGADYAQILAHYYPGTELVRPVS